MKVVLWGCPIYITSLLIVGSCVLALSSSLPDVDHHEVVEENVRLNDQCGLYLAPSSHPNFRYGVYTGKNIETNEMIGFPNLAINLQDLRANNLNEYGDDEDEYQFLKDQAQYIIEALWPPAMAGTTHEFEQDASFDNGEISEPHSFVAITGPPSLARYNHKTANADFDILSAYNRASAGSDSEPRGVNHPNRGSVSPFHNSVLRSTKPITAGSEIVIDFDYGNTEESDDELEDGPNVITDEDYVRIDETIEEMIAFFDKHDQNLDDEAKSEIYRFLTRDFMVAAVGEEKAPKVSELFPPMPDDLRKVKEAGGIAIYTNASGSSSRRTISWLEENGLCMDAIRPGPSTIPNAGRGAFATRAIQEGSTVAPVPLLHIPDKVALDMFELVITEDEIFARAKDTAHGGRQLLMNYVYSHPSTTMAFVPLGATAGLINHSDKPNAKMQWSNNSLLHQKKWFDVEPPDFLESDSYYAPGLMMEIVATREIQEGEEIFIDYGREWTQAWEEHVKQWVEKLNSGDVTVEWPIRAADLNHELTTGAIYTDEEQEEFPYPEHVSLKAFIFVDVKDAQGTVDDPLIWKAPRSLTSFSTKNMYDVTIIERFDVEIDTDDIDYPSYLYTVALQLDEQAGDDEDDMYYITDVPQEMFFFVDEAETGDQFTVEDPFRHYIGIPDDVFPQGPWRNVA